MKLLSAALLFVIFISSVTFSSKEWEIFYPPYTRFMDVSDNITVGNKFYSRRGNVIYSSVDGINWDHYLSDSSTYMSDICSDGDRIFIIKTNGETFISNDAGNTLISTGFTPPIPSNENSYKTGVIFNDIKVVFASRRLFVSDFNDSNYQTIKLATNSIPVKTKNTLLIPKSVYSDTIYYTTDGHYWTTSTRPQVGKIFSTDSLFILIPDNNELMNEVYVSKSGEDWTNVTDSTQFNLLIGLAGLKKLSDGTWLGYTKAGKRVTSTNGNEWEFTYVDLNRLYLDDFIVNNNLVILEEFKKLHVSTDYGNTFTDYDPSIYSYIYSIYNTDDMGIIGLKYDGISTSIDSGKTWNNISGTNVSSGNDIAAGGGKYISIGNGGNWSESTDGITWTPHVDKYLSGNRGGASLSWSGSYFTWIGGRHYPLKLINDTIWKPCTTDALVPTNCHVWGNGTMVAIGYTDTILVGEDVENLEVLTLPTGFAGLSAIHHNGEFFTTVGDSGLIISSIDGRNWTKATDVPTTAHLEGVSWTGNCWFAIGYDGTVLRSPDAKIWTRDFFPENDNLRSIGMCGSRLFIGGSKLYYLDVDNTPVKSITKLSNKISSPPISLVGNKIKVNVPFSGNLKVRMLDLKGREIAILRDEQTNAGNILIPLKNKTHASSLYIIDIRGANFTLRKMITSLR